MADQPEAPDMASQEPMDTSDSQVSAEAGDLPTSNSGSNENIMEETSTKETQVNDNETPDDNNDNDENTATNEDKKLEETNKEQNKDQFGSIFDQAFEESKNAKPEPKESSIFDQAFEESKNAKPETKESSIFDQAFEESKNSKPETKDSSSSPVKISLFRKESKTDEDVDSSSFPKEEMKEESSDNSQDSMENIEVKKIKLEIPKLEVKSKPLVCTWCNGTGFQLPCQGDLKKNVRNKGTMKRPNVSNKGVNVKPQPVHKTTQSEAPANPTLVPVAAPVFMPVPMQMYQRPFPVPVPIPLPIPVPIFVPTTRNSTRGVKKFLKKMKAKLPANVFEAQILEMAGALDDKNDPLDSDDSEWEDYVDDETEGNSVRNNGNGPPQPKLPNEDVEHIIRAGNIVPKPLPQVTPDACPSPNPPFGYRGSPTPRLIPGVKQEENRWQNNRPQVNRNRNANRGRRQSRPVAAVETNPALAALTLPPKERPDAKHHLKFTYGVNAWRHWVVGKNAELEKQRAQGKYMKPFETDILKLRADELNYTLCMFVKEVRKPNGDPYASDSILYLTLGIQEYLFENGRIDNIFTDMYYEPFTSANHEVIKDFKLPINELGYFVTRIEEEHLWEAKQLGAHSPQVLLNTLIYFNAKYFMMKTLDDHTKLSFTHIMKHWKKGGTATPATKNPPVPGEKRTTLLRYYPPAHLKGNRHDDRKCFEQQELPDNPLRCPVKLYEFYLSHCPESAKTKSDMFYLQPERSCVPDSPVWYSAQPLNSFQLEKMLARILMVREVQEHMLADAAAHA